MPPPRIIAPALWVFMLIFEIYLMSGTTSITRSFLNAFVNSTSPMPPSVMAGQNTGISFFQHQQYMLYSLFISFPSLQMSLRGVQCAFSLTCSLYILAKMGSRNSSSLMQFSFATRMLPILQCPFSLFSTSFILNSPKWNFPKHFIISSSMPPHVVTMQSTILCCARYRMMSLIPQELIFEVQPRYIVHLASLRKAGSLLSSSSLSFMGQSLSRQLIISFTISMALAR